MAVPVTVPRVTLGASLKLTAPVPLRVVLLKVSFLPVRPATFKVLPALTVRAPKPTVRKGRAENLDAELPVTLTALGKRSARRPW